MIESPQESAVVARPKCFANQPTDVPTFVMTLLFDFLLADFTVSETQVGMPREHI